MILLLLKKIYKNFKEPLYKQFETKDKYKKLMHKCLDENKNLSINDIPRYEEFLNEFVKVFINLFEKWSHGLCQFYVISILEIKK